MASASNPSAAAARAALTMPVETTAPRGPHGLDPGSSLEPPRPLRDSDPCIPAAGGGRKHTAVSATLRYRIRSIRNTTGRLIPVREQHQHRADHHRQSPGSGWESRWRSRRVEEHTSC